MFDDRQVLMCFSIAMLGDRHVFNVLQYCNVTVDHMFVSLCLCNAILGDRQFFLCDKIVRVATEQLDMAFGHDISGPGWQ